MSMVPVGESETMAMAFSDDDHIGYSPLQIPLYLITSQLGVIVGLWFMWRIIFVSYACIFEKPQEATECRLAAIFWLPVFRDCNRQFMASFYTFAVPLHYSFAGLLIKNGFAICGCAYMFFLIIYFVGNLGSHVYSRDLTFEWKPSVAFDIFNLRMEVISFKWWGGAIIGRRCREIGWEREMRAEYSRVYRYWLVRHMLLNATLLLISSYVTVYSNAFIDPSAVLESPCQTWVDPGNSTGLYIPSPCSSTNSTNATMFGLEDVEDLETEYWSLDREQLNGNNETDNFLRGMVMNSEAADKLRAIFDNPFHYMLGLSVVMSFVFTVDSFFAKYSDDIHQTKLPEGKELRHGPNKGTVKGKKAPFWMGQFFLLYIAAFLLARVAGFAMLVACYGPLGALFIPGSFAMRALLARKVEYIAKVDWAENKRKKLFQGFQCALFYFFFPVGLTDKDMYDQDCFHDLMFCKAVYLNLLCHLGELGLIVGSLFAADFHTENAIRLVCGPVAVCLPFARLLHMCERVFTPEARKAVEKKKKKTKKEKKAEEEEAKVYKSQAALIYSLLRATDMNEFIKRHTKAFNVHIENVKVRGWTHSRKRNY
jgi:hypothetical protein